MVKKESTQPFATVIATFMSRICNGSRLNWTLRCDLQVSSVQEQAKRERRKEKKEKEEVLRNDKFHRMLTRKARRNRRADEKNTLSLYGWLNENE